MWRKRKKSKGQHPFPGEPHAVDGHTALWAVERLVSSAIIVESAAEFAEVTGRLGRLVPGSEGVPEPTVRVVDRVALPAIVSGYTAGGLRAAGLLVDGGRLRESLYASAGKRLPDLFHLTCRAQRRHGGALRAGHDDFYDAADSGCFQFFAENVQQVADFALIARRVAELSLTPGVCAQDLYATSHSVQRVVLPGHDLIQAYLGLPQDMVPSQPGAQKVLFGPERRRAPSWVDLDHPAGSGGFHDHDSYYKAVAAQNVFFAGAVDHAIDVAMSEFEALTGRRYNRYRAHRLEDAEYIVVAQGDVVDALQAVVDYLRDAERIKVGMLSIAVARPFPAADLTRHLKGKRAVTILERTDRPLADDRPMTREVHAAINKAMENGAADSGDPPFAGYATYNRASDRPAVYSCAFGVGADIVAPADLAAAIRNMTPAGQRKRRFFLGINLVPETHRFPQLQTLQQRLERSYPELGRLSTPPAPPLASDDAGSGAIDLCALSGQGGLFATNLFVRALNETSGLDVRSIPDGGLERHLQPARVTLLRGERSSPPSRLAKVRTLLVSDHRLLENLGAHALEPGGNLVVGSSLEPEVLWRTVSARVARWIRERNLPVWIVDTRRIADDASSGPTQVDQLALWALLSSGVRIGWQLPDASVDQVVDALRQFAGQLFGVAHPIVEDIVKSAQRGAAEPTPLAWANMEREEVPVESEHEVPWAVAQTGRSDETVFDVSRFWRSVGFLYDSGQAKEALVDPYVATGVLPARSGMFRDMTPYRLRIPRWLPENCTGCGSCWAVCPESALPPTVQTVTALLQAAIDQCEAAGAMMIQMTRLRDSIAKQAHRLVGRDDLKQYRALGPLIRDAFAQVSEKSGLKGKALESANTELEHIVGRIDHYPVARTEIFYEAPEKGAKGSGALLSIALNPSSCTGCGLCLAVCPDEAFDWREQTTEAIGSLRHDWQYQMALPRVAPEIVSAHVSSEKLQTHVNHLLDSGVYHSMVGGDGSFAGSGVKIALHLLTAAVESVMQPRFDAHVERLSLLIENLEQRIQGDVSDAVKISDFEEFARRLDRFAKSGHTRESLDTLVGDAGGVEVDAKWLSRASRLLARLKSQRDLYTEGSTGHGRSRMVLAVDADNPSFWSATFPFNPHTHPWIAHLAGDAPALAEGISAAIAHRVVAELKDCRIAALELSGRYDAQEHDAYFERFGWKDLDENERSLMPPVIVICPAERARSLRIAGALESDRPIKVALLNRGAVEANAATESMMAQVGGRAFVVQSAVGDAGHLIQGVREGAGRSGPALFHIYAPDPHVSGIAADAVVAHAQSASAARVVPLITRGAGTLSTVVLSANADPGEDWTTREMVAQTPAGVTEKVVVPHTPADWAFQDQRWRDRFEIVSKGSLGDHMKTVPEYLSLTMEERESCQPYIRVLGEGEREFLAIVPRDVMELTETRLATWRALRGSIGASRTEPAAQAPPPPPPAPAPVAKEALEQLTERLLVLCGYQEDPDFFKRSLSEFIGKAADEAPDD